MIKLNNKFDCTPEEAAFWRESADKVLYAFVKSAYRARVVPYITHSDTRFKGFVKGSFEEVNIDGEQKLSFSSSLDVTKYAHDYSDEYPELSNKPLSRKSFQLVETELSRLGHTVFSDDCGPHSSADAASKALCLKFLKGASTDKAFSLFIPRDFKDHSIWVTEEQAKGRLFPLSKQRTRTAWGLVNKALENAESKGYGLDLF